jgi:hypothetical protein
MRCVRGVAAALLAAAVLNVAPVQAQAPAGSPERDSAHLLLFASTDLWRHGGFAHGGFLWSPEGLDHDGFALKIAFGGGSYRYTSESLGHIEVDGRQLAGQMLFGWRVVRGRLFLTTFAGFDFQQHRLQPDDPSAGLRGGYVGVRGGFELWYEPLPHVMVAAHGFVSNVGPSYSARLATGRRVFERYYLGPEVEAFAAGNNYRQIRAGAHVTALPLGDWEWSAGIGWAGDSDDRSSLYGRLGVLTRR